MTKGGSGACMKTDSVTRRLAGNDDDELRAARGGRIMRQRKHEGHGPSHADPTARLSPG